MKARRYSKLISLLLVMVMIGCSFSFAYAEQQPAEGVANGNEQADGVQGDDPNENDDPEENIDAPEGDDTVPGEDGLNDDKSDQDGQKDEDMLVPENDGQEIQDDGVQKEDEPNLLVKKDLSVQEEPLKIEITSITSEVATGYIKLKWTKVEGATRYVIFRTTDGKNFKKVATTTKRYYTNRNIVPRTKYGYKVVACIEKGGKVVERVSSKVKYKTASGIGNVGKVATVPGYQSVTLRWKKVKDAKYYEIVRWDSSTNKKVTLKSATTKGNTSTANKNYIVYKDTGASGGNVRYAYSIWAVRTAKVNGKTVTIRSKARAATPTVMCVRQMYQTIYFGESATLTSHAGPSVTRTFYPGTPIVTTGFGGGQYKFWYNGSLFYANYTRVSYAECDYSRGANYSKASATDFVNGLEKAGQLNRSSTGYLIWVSTYTQHLYVFKWNSSARRWVHVRDWECSTGTAGSPTRIDTAMNIEARYSYEGGIPYWNCFSGMNAIHGKKDSYVIDGAPHSHGCVRNYNSDAGWIWDNCYIGTAVAIY